MVSHGQPWLTILFYHSQPSLNHTEKTRFSHGIFGRADRVADRQTDKQTDKQTNICLRRDNKQTAVVS